jgi:flagellar biosynthesis/type III secretory pathway protein FliH
MAFITNAERQAMAKARELGWAEGYAKGLEEGAREASLRLLRALLKAKFGKEGEDLMTLVQEQSPVPCLEEMVIQVGIATKIDSLPSQLSQS